jgi:hypothetical protein
VAEKAPCKKADASKSWKSQSGALREAMKQSRLIKRAEEQAKRTGKPLASFLPAPTAAAAPDPSLVPCEHCGRSFSAEAAARHMPHCKKKAQLNARHCGAKKAKAAPKPSARRSVQNENSSANSHKTTFG